MRLNGRQITAYYQGRTTLPNGKHSIADAPGLYLRVSGPKAASWVVLATIAGTRMQITIGSFTGAGRIVRYSVADARAEADKIRVNIANDQHPLVHRVVVAPTAPVFAAVLDTFLAGRATQWKGDGTEKQWRQQLGKHCADLLKTPVNRIDTSVVETTLLPIWSQTLGETQRFRIASVLDYARVKGFRSGDNPARWEGHLEYVMPHPPVVKGKDSKGKDSNYARLGHNEVPAFMAQLAAQGSMAAKVFLFTILTAARVSEAAEARWSELDLDAALWTVPAERMKAGEEHIVPLSRQAVELLRSLEKKSEWVFPAAKDAAKPTNTKLLNELVEKLGHKGRTTVHGFRGTFRTWGENQHSRHGTRRYDDAHLEWCIAHQITNKTKKAYLDQAVVELRRIIMQDWADFATGSNVVQLRGVA